MPTYEAAFVLRQLPRSELIAIIKRTAETILEKGGIIRRLDHLGMRPLPNKTSVHGLVHKSGAFFTVQFDSAPHHISDLKEMYGRDVDIIRRHIFNIDSDRVAPVVCTLAEDLQPPASRPDVKKLIEASKPKKTYQYNSGFAYYPFQK